MVSAAQSDADKTSADWVQGQVDAILSAHDDDAVGQAMPVLVMMLADAYGADRLDPDMQAILQKVGHRLELQEGMPEPEVRHRVADFVEGLQIEPELLEALKAVFEAHEAARATERPRRRLELGFARPTWRPYSAPAGTPSSRFTAQTRGMILMR